MMMFLTTLLVAVMPAAGEQVLVRLSTDGKQIELVGIEKPDPARLIVRLGTGTAQDIAARPAVLGESQVIEKGLRFVPRFPFTPGVTYLVTYGEHQKTVVVPKSAIPPDTVVSEVHPADKTWPENTLRVYVHFSRPMARGDVYQHIRLMCGEKAVNYPFLELAEELWSEDGKRFTLLFDPGRVKRGLKPREELGPPLEEGKKYSLVIDRKWKDENGAELKETFRKEFAVGPPDETPIDPLKKWYPGRSPIAGTSEGYTVKFGPKLIDHALANRFIWIVGPDGQRVAGTTKAGEHYFSFRPATDWKVGEYKLLIDTRLEDVCGNRVGEAFEVDVFKPVQQRIESKTVELRFTVK